MSRDITYLLDILDSATLALSYIQGKSEDVFSVDNDIPSLKELLLEILPAELTLQYR